MVLIDCLNDHVGAVGVVESSQSCNSGDLQVAAHAADWAAGTARDHRRFMMLIKKVSAY